jgi:chemotaxis protein MotA
MFFIIGLVVVIGCVLGGFLAAGGHILVLWQPFEFLIIFGAAIGAYLIANPMTVLVGTGKALGLLFKGSKANKEAYLRLLGLLYTLFKLARSKGDLALESHIDRPYESTLFQKHPDFLGNHHAVDFLCDYLRLLTLGQSKAHELEAIIDAEIDGHRHERHAVSGALQAMSDGLPALGIVAAVLGVIHTMGSITEPPAVLGHLIGGALVGTFTGVLASYGIIAPMAKSLETIFEAETHYFECIKTALIAHIQGYAPQVSIELARKTLHQHVRPSFGDVDAMVQTITT